MKNFQKTNIYSLLLAKVVGPGVMIILGLSIAGLSSKMHPEGFFDSWFFVLLGLGLITIGFAWNHSFYEKDKVIKGIHWRRAILRLLVAIGLVTLVLIVSDFGSFNNYFWLTGFVLGVFGIFFDIFYMYHKYGKWILKHGEEAFYDKIASKNPVIALLFDSIWTSLCIIGLIHWDISIITSWF